MLKSVSVSVLAVAMSCSLFIGGEVSAQGTNCGRPGCDRNSWTPQHHHKDHQDNTGAIVAAGIFGLVAGAAIASANANRYDPPPEPIPYSDIDPYTTPYRSGDWHAYCAAKFDDYDPRSGTYLAVDGRRYPCH
jgi:hypothetical protein